MAFSFNKWIHQLSTIIGIATVVSLGVAFGIYFATHDPKAAVAAAGTIFSAICMALNDKTADKSSVEQLAADAIQAAMKQRFSEMMPQLVGDVTRVFQQAIPQPMAAPAPMPPPQVLPITPPVIVQQPAPTAMQTLQTAPPIQVPPQ